MNEQIDNAVGRAHTQLIHQILAGEYPVGSELPGERTLSKDLGLARNALREAMQRMRHDGWLEVQQGRTTRVRDYLRDGNMNILIDLLDAGDERPATLSPDLMRMWSLLAADYAYVAVDTQPRRVQERVALYDSLEDTPEACAKAMWQLHRMLIDYCGNLVYGLVFNSFIDFYQRLALEVYTDPAARQRASTLWANIDQAASERQPARAADTLSRYIQTMYVNREGTASDDEQ